MQSKLLSRRDLEFLLYEWLDAAALCKRRRYAEHTRETFDAILNTAEALANDHLVPHNRKSDIDEPVFDGERVSVHPDVGKALGVLAEAGFFAATFSGSKGGLQLPFVVDRAAFSLFSAANISTTSYVWLTTAAAHLLDAHGDGQQVAEFMEPMLQGRFFGTMCLSEPQAGSSLGDIATRAERQPDGTFRLFGTKNWVSAGDHELAENIIHLVLARITGAPEGTSGLSLFVVPKSLVEEDGSLGARNDVALAGLNHKMGYRGITNCVLNFGEGKWTPGDSPGAIGYLVGAPGEGLRLMFHMMNEARVTVGLGASCLAYTGYLHALAYAQERRQGRKTGTSKTAGAQVPIIEHTDVKHMLLQQKVYAEGGLALGLYCAKLVDEQRTAASDHDREDAELLLDLLTPIAKSWPSQWGPVANDLAIQVHGGYGYTRDFPVEQFYRDNRLNPIHEGTHGIQALDLLGRKVAKIGARGPALLESRILQTARRSRAARVPEFEVYATHLERGVERLIDLAMSLHSLEDPERMLANATPYLEAAGHVAVAWIWLDQALATLGKDGPYYEGKRQACRYFYRWELPKTEPVFDRIADVDRTVLEMQEDWF